jgi:hypothetical protein
VRLNIAIEHIQRVEMRNGQNQLRREESHPGIGKAAEALDQGFEISPREKFHPEV